MAEKHYSFSIRDKDGNVVRSGTIFAEEVQSVGGIGNFVESITHTLKDEQSIKIGIFYR